MAPVRRVDNNPEIDIIFLDGNNDQICRSQQAGKTSWGDVREWLDIYLPYNGADEYNIYNCSEEGDPQNPLQNHGPAINTSEAEEVVVIPGYYLLLKTYQGYEFQVCEELPLMRISSQHLTPDSPRTGSFSSRVKARDGRCVVVGGTRLRNFQDLEASHIFPLEHNDEWNRQGWSQAITDTNNSDIIGWNKIHSAQNGITLSASAHRMFDRYWLAINPRRGYKVTVFGDDPHHWDGKIAALRQDVSEDDKVLDSLLAWHFRQAVLVNMRGRGGLWDFEEPGGDYNDVAVLNSNDDGKKYIELYLAQKFCSV